MLIKADELLCAPAGMRITPYTLSAHKTPRVLTGSEIYIIGVRLYNSIFIMHRKAKIYLSVRLSVMHFKKATAI